MAANLVLPAQVLQKAMRIRALVRREWLKLFEECDVLISPTMMYKIGKISYGKPINSVEDAIPQFGKGTGDATIPAPFTGTPAITVPCGFDSNNVPIGLQIMGSHFREEIIIKVAYAYEQSTPWHTKRPSL